MSSIWTEYYTPTPRTPRTLLDCNCKDCEEYFCNKYILTSPPKEEYIFYWESGDRSIKLVGNYFSTRYSDRKLYF
jgi:hypothetical protein